MEIIGNTIADVWEKSIEALLASDAWIPTERGINTVELQNILLRINSPTTPPQISDKYQFSHAFIKAHTSLLEPYWESVMLRLRQFGKGKVNQIDYVIRNFHDIWYSRRSYVSVWDPYEDIENLHPPCPVGLHFLIRNERLHMTSIFRSNDAWLQALPDMIAMTAIQSLLAKELNLQPGEYTHFSISYHMYETDLICASEIFGRDSNVQTN